MRLPTHSGGLFSFLRWPLQSGSGCLVFGVQKVGQQHHVVTRKSAFLMPLVDFMHVMPAAVRRGCAVNDDAVYVPCFHAAMMAAGGGLGKAEGVPP